VWTEFGDTIRNYPASGVPRLGAGLAAGEARRLGQLCIVSPELLALAKERIP
jgi:hypothetical protein